MNLFPFSNNTNIDVTKTELPIYKEVAWDFIYNKPIIENGDFKIVEKNEAIKVWIFKAILTPRYKFGLYSWNYGSELKALIGRAYSSALIKEEAKRYIKEALLINPYINHVEVQTISLNDDVLNIDVKIDTIYGESEVYLNV